MFAYCNNNSINFEDHTGTSLRHVDVLRSRVGAGVNVGGGIGGLEGIIGGLTLVLDGLNHLIESAKAKAATRANKTYKHEEEEHHIVAENSYKAAPARAILNEVFPEEGTNISINKIFISTNLHKSVHTNFYYGLVNHFVITAYYSANGDPTQEMINVTNALGVISAALWTADQLWPR